mgnify:CR=1 FL=1
MVNGKSKTNLTLWALYLSGDRPYNLEGTHTRKADTLEPQDVYIVYQYLRRFNFLLSSLNRDTIFSLLMYKTSLNLLILSPLLIQV